VFARGESDEAIEVFRDLTRLRPKNGLYLICLGKILQDCGRPKEAEPMLERAVASFREAIPKKPDDALSHYQLGIALHSQGKLDLAVAEDRDAIRLKPDYADAHLNLGVALKDQGKLALAVEEYPEVIRLRPDYAEAHCNLGRVLRGMVQSEVTSSIVAGVCDPGGPRTAGLTEASHNARPVAARAEKPGCYPKTAAFEPCLLRSQGDYAGSLAMYRRGHELGSKQPGWSYPSAQWIAETAPMAALVARLPALLKGKDRPKRHRLAIRPRADMLRCEALCRFRPVLGRGARGRPETRRRPSKFAPLQRRLRRSTGRFRPGEGRPATR
jgi:tetratricopeptide (TPR) repeat protein